MLKDKLVEAELEAAAIAAKVESTMHPTVVTAFETVRLHKEYEQRSRKRAKPLARFPSPMDHRDMGVEHSHSNRGGTLCVLPSSVDAYLCGLCGRSIELCSSPNCGRRSSIIFGTHSCFERWPDQGRDQEGLDSPYRSNRVFLGGLI